MRKTNNRALLNVMADYNREPFECYPRAILSAIACTRRSRSCDCLLLNEFTVIPYNNSKLCPIIMTVHIAFHLSAWPMQCFFVCTLYHIVYCINVRNSISLSSPYANNERLELLAATQQAAIIGHWQWRWRKRIESTRRAVDKTVIHVGTWLAKSSPQISKFQALCAQLPFHSLL